MLAISWEQTAIWRRICEIESSDRTESLRASVRAWLPDIEVVLRSAATSPNDFTLHDDGHAFRVANSVVDLIPDDVFRLLPADELALLLLASYLHDIGMSPEGRRVALHHDLLISGEADGASVIEQREFQSWLDIQGQGYILTLADTIPLQRRLQLANRLVTHYVRARHNDWSEQWIRAYWKLKPFPSYEGWLDDLILLCKSHHYDYGILASSRFDPHLVGSPSTVINLRYLAAALRVADILDFDPERTPEVILRQRNISPASLIYWHKDKQISKARDGNRLVISGRPTTAVIHRAIEETINAIDVELGLCQRLAHDVRFDLCPGFSGPLCHRWDIAGSVHATIVPKLETYEYIDGSFRPNTEKLLQLLSGNELYGDPIVAVRELLQNAFDAIKEDIARHMLTVPTLSESTASSMHRVALRVESSTDGVLLVCTDTGAGMSKAIVRDHFLVSGAGRRPDLLDLERRCKSAEVPFERTGSFGIGVLSYFMLADRIIVRSRRSANANDAEPTGWAFEIDGVGSFGELRRDTSIQTGTEVRLLLREEVLRPNAEAWYQALKRHIEQIIIFKPCRLELTSNLPNCQSLIFPPGWMDKTREWTQAIVDGVQPMSPEQRQVPGLLTAADRREMDLWQQHWTDLKSAIGAALRWHFESGTLQDGLGTYQLALPYFVLDGGESLAFLSLSGTGEIVSMHKVGHGLCYIPEGKIESAWKGIKISPTGINQGWRLPVLARVNLISPAAGTLAIHRHSFLASSEAGKAIEWVKVKAADLCELMLKASPGSEFAPIGYRIIRHKPSMTTRCWACIDSSEGRSRSWRVLRPPYILSAAFSYLKPPRELVFRGAAVLVLSGLGEPTEHQHHEGLSYAWRFERPDVIVAYDHFRKMTPVWTRPPKLNLESSPFGAIVRFPPLWKSLLLSVLEYPMSSENVYWNREHSLVRSFDNDAFLKAPKPDEDPIPVRALLLSDKRLAAAWLAKILIAHAERTWHALIERDADLTTGVLNLLFGRKGSKTPSVIALPVWHGKCDLNKELSIVTTHGWRLASAEEREMILQGPGPEWTIVDLGKQKTEAAAIKGRQRLVDELAAERRKGRPQLG